MRMSKVEETQLFPPQANGFPNFEKRKAIDYASLFKKSIAWGSSSPTINDNNRLVSISDVGQTEFTWYESEYGARLPHQWGYLHSFEAGRSIA